MHSKIPLPLTIIAQLAYFRQYMLSSIFCLNFEKFKGSSFDEDVSFRSQKANSLLDTSGRNFSPNQSGKVQKFNNFLSSHKIEFC